MIAIAAGTCLGLVAAVVVGYRATRQTPSTTAQVATVKLVSATTPAPKAPAVDAAIATGSIAVAVVEQPQQPSIPLSSVSAPSCRELLASSYVEKLDAAGAFAQTQLGKSELVRGNVAGAEQAFCNASLWDAKNVERWLNLAQLFLIRKDGAKAVECAQTALALQPDSSRALTAAGDAWAILGKLKEAREAYLSAEKRPEPDRGALQLMIRRDLEEAYRMVKARDFARAERVFRRVVVFDSENAAASAGVAQCLVKLGDKDSAEAWQRRAESLQGR
jgi:tetratricopeptide (TPR) repeat protein